MKVDKDQLQRQAAASVRLLNAIDDAERKAWKALAGYKFWMFGYWAAKWVDYNRLLGGKRPNPFKEMVQIAEKKTCRK